MTNVPIPEETEKEKLNTIIYPSSVSLSYPIKVQDAYNEIFSESLFLVYLGIYSMKEKSEFVVNTTIVDINEKTEGSCSIRNFNTLDDEDFHLYVKSLSLIFSNYKRNILILEDKSYKMSEYLSLVKEWVEKMESNI